jgi:PAS domain S-box-containing protein
MEEVKAGEHFSSSLRHLRKDGRILYVEKTGTEFTFKGKPHLLAVVHDETERKKAEAALRESEDRFRTLADNIPNLAWIANEKGAIVWFNKRWYEYTGMNEKMIQLNDIQHIQDPDELDWVTDKWNKAITSGEPFEMIIRLKGADKIFRPFLTRVVPVKNEKNKIVRWFGTNTDITDQIKTEEILERKNRELIKINNDLDNFIYTASHDLKSPVSNLEGLLNMVSDEDEALITEKGKSVLPMVSQSLTRLKTVIKELTEIARIQKDIGGEEEVIHLQSFLQEILDNLVTDLKKFNGHINVDFSTAPKLKFSKKNLRSILYNLISNALKYSDPSKEGTIQVSSQNLGDQILLTISDNGLGIPEQQIHKVFTMFKRYHTHVEGSGVGLYIVKRIIENAGGKIELNSEVGKGSTFKIYLPL